MCLMKTCGKREHRNLCLMDEETELAEKQHDSVIQMFQLPLAV